MNSVSLKEMRKAKGETQSDLAALLGLKTASAYNKKENGKVPLTLNEAKILADHFGKPLDIFCI